MTPKGPCDVTDVLGAISYSMTLYHYQGCSRGRDLRDQDRDMGGRDQDRDHLN